MAYKEEKLSMFENRLTKVFKHKKKQATKQEVSCWRVYDHDIPEFPVCIELYDDKVYIAEYLRRHGMTDEEHNLWLDDMLAVVIKILGVDINNIYLKQRRKMDHRNQQYEKVDSVKEFFEVLENGMKFRINLDDYLDTGLFLDHRITRKMVKDQCKDLSVLNLFCYTGSFSVYAAIGGASKVVSVDMSNTYISWAEENFKTNELIDPDKYIFLREDVIQYLDKYTGPKFDIIIVDPPTFSNSKKMKDFFDVQQHHVSLINNCIKILNDGGTVYFSTNLTTFQIDKESIKATTIKDITKQTTPFDFEGKLQRWCYKIEK
ncbi:MAG: class I SAM-dependent methyltransferase [Bacteroidota bacterium]